MPSLRFGDLRGDRALVELARGWVAAELARDPGVSSFKRVLRKAKPRC
jgi:hypothetical protein